MNISDKLSRSRVIYLNKRVEKYGLSNDLAVWPYGGFGVKPEYFKKRSFPVPQYKPFEVYYGVWR